VRGPGKPSLSVRLHSFCKFGIPVILNHLADAELLTVSQAADALNASTQTIRNWIRSDRLKGVRIGNRFLVPRTEVERLRGDVGSPVGESPEELEVPVEIRYGMMDVLVPPSHGKWLAAPIPHAKVTVDEHGGHLSTPDQRLERLRALEPA
jgi:excisionase family DNA binding protein